MCWVCDIENLKAQIAEENINVYKIVRKANKESCVSLFIEYTYYKNSIPPSRILEVRIGSSYSFAKIEEGYYSYSSVSFICDSVRRSIDGKLYKAMQCGNRKEMFRVDNSLYLATFVIPAGSVYFINEDGVIVSNKICYTGKYIKL